MLTLISSIAEQTDLLALNATIEANSRIQQELSRSVDTQSRATTQFVR